MNPKLPQCKPTTPILFCPGTKNKVLVLLFLGSILPKKIAIPRFNCLKAFERHKDLSMCAYKYMYQGMAAPTQRLEVINK